MKLRHLGRAVIATIAVGIMAAGVALFAPTASAHESGHTVNVFPPITGASTWDRFGHSPPSSHHRVFYNWGYLNDWSVDIYRAPGATVVSPFGTTTSAGNPVSVTVVTVAPGCATGNLADGGYRIGLEARDTSTGDILARADVMHVTDKPADIVVGATVGPWTPLGTTGRFRYSSCYQVNGDSGVHIHLEVINHHRYSCYVYRDSGTEMNDLTVIGLGGSHYSGPRQSC
ncbi:hypothetical protein FB566_0833 [Stackebrandtia endophytica]|uniref:Peptidase M23-like protein n=1 Tax=Stackebrandtia endophytica TaxID=1496996 RepID=A0A543AS10_9ACTN|nr:hypothetical protein [Stackebrandtia endophytica]TQL75336.1 hypothetical protein FB566_0833 [Stackebrandtia endophytica]